MTKQSLIPAFELPLALPIIAAALWAGGISQAMAQSAGGVRLDEGLLPVGLILGALVPVLGFVWWFANDRAKSRAQMKELKRELKVATQLARIACESSPQVDDKHGRIRELIVEAKMVEKESDDDE